MCSKICKYAYLSKRFSNKNINNNCTEDYVRLYPNEEINYDTTTYHNQLSWKDMSEYFPEELS